MTTPAAALFDNDGLLLDTETVWTRGEEDLFERRDLEFTLADKRELIGTSAHTAGAILAKRLGEVGREAELIAELDELVYEQLESGVEPMAGARELVAELRDRGIPLGLVSNSPRSFIDRALELVEMTEVFSSVVSGHDVEAPKPEPHAYLAACEELGVPPAQSIALEDSPTGVAAARAAGMTVIGVPSFPGVVLDEADLVGESLRDPAVWRRLGLA